MDRDASFSSFADGPTSSNTTNLEALKANLSGPIGDRTMANVNVRTTMGQEAVVTVPSQSTLTDLRAAIAKVLSLSVDSFDLVPSGRSVVTHPTVNSNPAALPNPALVCPPTLRLEEHASLESVGLAGGGSVVVQPRLRTGLARPGSITSLVCYQCRS